MLAALQSVALATAGAQDILIAPRFLYFDTVTFKESQAAWKQFRPGAGSGGLPARCYRPDPPLPGMPEYDLLVPAWERTETHMFLWPGEDGTSFRAQLVRHRKPLPIVSGTLGTERVVDPITKLTDHTVISIDFGDRSISVYNIEAGRSTTGVSAEIGRVDSLPLVRESLEQVEAARRLCWTRYRSKPHSMRQMKGRQGERPVGVDR